MRLLCDGSFRGIVRVLFGISGIQQCFMCTETSYILRRGWFLYVTTLKSLFTSKAVSLMTYYTLHTEMNPYVLCLISSQILSLCPSFVSTTIKGASLSAVYAGISWQYFVYTLFLTKIWNKSSQNSKQMCTSVVHTLKLSSKETSVKMVKESAWKWHPKEVQWGRVHEGESVRACGNATGTRNRAF